jgi:nucleoside-diphosphate-sugar epimerase
MTKKKILICGATGFIGKNSLERFTQREDYEIRAVYHIKPPLKEYDVEWVQADLNNVEDVKRVIKGMDIVLQLAATTSGANDIINRPYIHVTDNAVMNSLLLREAFENDIEHFIFPSCTVMYQPNSVATKESNFDGNQRLLSKYFGVGNTKVYIEKMCDFYGTLGKTKHTVLRQSNIYGPHDKYDLKKSHVFGATITKVMTNDEKINVWGPGTETRDFLYVDDLLNFIELALEKQESMCEVFNVGCGYEVSIKELVEKIIKISGKDLKMEHDLSKPHIPTKLFLDCTKAKEMLGWEPKVSLEEGIKRSIDWWKANND